MKKWVGLLIVLSLAASVHAGLDISFSSDNGGNWSYTAETKGTGIFSFEVASVDSLPDVDTPVTLNDSISIQSLEVRDLQEVSPGTGVYMGNIITSPSTLVEITKGSGGGKRILTGNLSEGAIVVVGATATLYPYIDDPYIDITNTNWYDWDGPELMDFSLTMQGDIDIADMIMYSDKDDSTIVGGTFSGSISVPEPATFFILAFGSVLFWRKEKTA